MRYVQYNQGTSYAYPSHNIDPAKKDEKWGAQYAKAGYCDWSFNVPKGVFASNQGDYEKFRMYALGKQPVTPYKKMLGVDEQTDNTWLSVDWNVRAIVSPYRDKAISRLMEHEYGIVATPIDMTAHAELEDYYAQMKARLAVKQLMEQQNQELANHPLISLQNGDPMDMEELEMRIALGEQFNRSKDAELAIELGFYENNYNHVRRTIYEDLFDYGIAGTKEWLGDDNKPKFRKVKPDCVVTNFCKESNFSDLVQAGELIDVSLIDLALIKNADGSPKFTEQELQEFAGSIAGKWGNPGSLGAGNFKPYDKFKCKVLDFEFFSYNDMVFRNAADENGNSDFRKADYNRGKKSEKYIRKRIKVIYKIKWIVGTDKCYDFGLANDMKRSVDAKKKAETSLSYKFYAYNFFEMRAQGFMERLIPYLDDYQLTMLKIQNFKNRAVPSGWWIDLDGLERSALNKGGKNMTPLELLKMFFETGVLVGRSQTADGSPAYTNVQPVIPISNTAATELAMFYQDLVATIQSIERLTGYNDISMGEGNPKTLVPGYEIANMSTNHALFPMRFAEKYLTERLAEDVLLRMKQGVKKGGISGYAPALNQNILRFIQISPDIALREYGIMLESKTTDEQKAWLYQMMQGDIANGFLDVSDAVYIVNVNNVKQAQSIWAYRVKKAKEAMQKQKMAEIEATNQGNLAAAQAASQEKLMSKQMEVEARLQEEQMRINGELAKEQMKTEKELMLGMKELELKYAINQESNQTKVVVAEIAAEAKTESQIISSEGDLTKAELAGEYNLEKQKEANKKPQPKSSTTKK